MSVLVSGIGVVASLLAAFFWLWASLVTIPDNQDTFIAALQSASRLNAYGALSACVAAASAAFLFARDVGWV